MEVITKQQLINTVAERFKGQYFRAGWRDASFFRHRGTSPKLVHEQLVELGDDATGEQVAEIIGNSGWTRNECDECQREREVVVQLGEELSYESSTAKVCLECLARATSMCLES